MTGAPLWQTMAPVLADPNGKHVMVDIDDVLFPLATGLHAKAHAMGLHDNTETALRVWHGHKQYGCTVEQWIEVFDALIKDDDYYRTAEPIPGSIEALRRLLWEGHVIHLVTARGFMAHGEEIRAFTRDWIDEWAVPHHSLTFAKDKPAAQLDLGVRFDYALDDGVHNYRDLWADGVTGARLLTVPHNEDEDVRADHRVSSVDDFVDIILKEAA